MSVESATYISQLVSANPAGADPVSDGATHLRLVKSVLQAQFPNIGAAAVTATAAQLNGNLVPIGLVSMWYGSIGSIPAGWALCNGGTYTRSDGGGNIVAPNLMDKFPVGAGSSYSVGLTGGAVTITPTGTVASYTLTATDIPSHSHGVNDPTHSHGVSDPTHAHLYNQPASTGIAVAGSNFGVMTTTSVATTNYTGTNITINGNGTGISIQSSGGGGGHAHGLTINNQENRPPFYGIAFIMKI